MRTVLLRAWALAGLACFCAAAAIMPARPAEAKDEKQEGQPVTPLFVNVGPMIVPVIGPNGPVQNLVLMVTLEVFGEDKRDRLRNQSPRLVHAYLTALYGGIDRGQIIDGHLVNLDEVKAKLTDATVEVVGPDMISDLLIQGISQRPVQ